MSDDAPAVVQNGQPLSESKVWPPAFAEGAYRGDAVVHWTLTTFDRAKACASEHFHRRFRELMLHVCARFELACPIYTTMPDHVHLIWMGLALECDQLKAMAFFRTYLEPCLQGAKFQHQAHDRVLRATDRRRGAFADLCRYIAENLVRAGLVSERGEWPCAGCMFVGYPDLNPFAEDYWPKFWRIFHKARRPNAGEIVRPRIGYPT